MRLAVISDIHGNLEALQAVLQDIEREGVDEIVCLGDIVGYGPDPNACCELVRQSCSTVVLGNHDEWTIHPPAREAVSPLIWKSIEWTTAQLDPKHKEYFSGLPLIVVRDELIFVHSAPVQPGRWVYVSDERTAARYLDAIGSATCFLGHTHSPGIYRGDSIPSGDVESGRGTIINVGSVGQPRDGNPAASYVIFDREGTASAKEMFRRREYDFRETSTKITLAGLPNFFALRLSTGR